MVGLSGILYGGKEWVIWHVVMVVLMVSFVGSDELKDDEIKTNIPLGLKVMNYPIDNPAVHGCVFDE